MANVGVPGTPIGGGKTGMVSAALVAVMIGGMAAMGGVCVVRIGMCSPENTCNTVVIHENTRMDKPRKVVLFTRGGGEHRCIPIHPRINDEQQQQTTATNRNQHDKP